jgi:hypothetical protein
MTGAGADGRGPQGVTHTRAALARGETRNAGAAALAVARG